MSPPGKGTALRELHARGRPLITPLAHDALSARLIAAAGFQAFNIGGSAMLAARYALPDIGLAALGEMLAGARDILDAVPLPCMIDADDGYGDVKSVAHTIERYEAIGAAGAFLEDQVRTGKRPGSQAARGVVPLEIMEQKLRAALAARRDPAFVVIGRTDAAGAEGLDEALRRAERFLALGADGVFVPGLKSEAELARVGAAFKGSWNAAVMLEGRGPWLTPAELFALGFSQVSYPNSLILRTTAAIERGIKRLSELAAGRDIAAAKEELPFETLQKALDLERWGAIEGKFS
jgi:2-methylisocitrate lyase-like PEP mutase family enzyme